MKEFAQNRERQVDVWKKASEETFLSISDKRLKIVQGLTTLLPVRLQCSDGELSLYPGDSM